MKKADARGIFQCRIDKKNLGATSFRRARLLTKIMEHYHVSSVVRKSMKIVHIIIGLNIGGAELSLKRLIDTQHKNNNFEHTVVSLTDIGPIGRQLIDAGIAVHSIGMRNVMNVPLHF